MILGQLSVIKNLYPISSLDFVLKDESEHLDTLSLMDNVIYDYFICFTKNPRDQEL